MSELEQLAANPWVAPSRVLLGHPQHQLPALGRDPRSPPPRPVAERCPLPLHQGAMPAQYGSRSHQQSCPRRLRQPIAHGRQQDSIAWLPTYPLDLALQDLNLTPQHQHFGLEAGLIAATGRHQVDHDPKQRVDQRSQHPARHPSSLGPAAAHAPQSSLT
jgi:hypothetical protein